MRVGKPKLSKEDIEAKRLRDKRIADEAARAQRDKEAMRKRRGMSRFVRRSEAGKRTSLLGTTPGPV